MRGTTNFCPSGAVVVEARRIGIARLFTEASITARPFFEAQSFVVLAPQVITVRGVDFLNERMGQVLAEPSNAADLRYNRAVWIVPWSRAADCQRAPGTHEMPRW